MMRLYLLDYSGRAGDFARKPAQWTRGALGVFVLLALAAAVPAQLNYQYSFSGPAGVNSYGGSLDRIGDVDGDGVDDLIIGASNYDFFSPTYGFVEVRSGATGALIYSIVSPLVSDAFGCSVAAVGDVDLDSVPDFVVGAFRSNYFGLDNGRVDVYSGATGAFILTLFGPGPMALFGTNVEHLGDVNGDGITDLAVSAPGFGPGGSIYIISGQSGAVLQLIQGTVASSQSSILERIGDSDGDGIDDVVVGSAFANTPNSPFTGALEAYSTATGALLFRVDGQHYGAYFGQLISKIGDVNDDGVADLIVSAHNTHQSAVNTSVGRVFVLSGVDGAVIHDIMGVLPRGYLGTSILGIDDLTGDGAADFLVGQFDGFQNGSPVDFKVSLYSGRTGTELSFLSGSSNVGFGFKLDSAGDIDGDGLKDVVVQVHANYSSNVRTKGVYLTSMMTPPTVGGGQANGVDATLLVNDIATGPSAGPFSSSIQRGLWFSIDLYGAPFALYEVYSSPNLNPGGWLFPGFGSLDIGTGPSFGDIAVMFPGFTSTFPIYALDATGAAHHSFYLPPSWPTGAIGGLQALVQRPQPWAGNLWGALSAAHELVLQ